MNAHPLLSLLHWSIDVEDAIFDLHGDENPRLFNFLFQGLGPTGLALYHRASFVGL